MPRQVAPPPSGEFKVDLRKPFSGTPTYSVEVIGEPNRPAVVKVSQYNGGSKSSEKTGDVSKDDVNELMSLVSELRGFPTHPSKDIYGADTKVDFNTFDIQWSNQDEGPGADDKINEIGEEQIEDFKRIADSIENLARTFAKQNSAV